MYLAAVLEYLSAENSRVSWKMLLGTNKKNQDHFLVTFQLAVRNDEELKQASCRCGLSRRVEFLPNIQAVLFTQEDREEKQH